METTNNEVLEPTTDYLQLIKESSVKAAAAAIVGVLVSELTKSMIKKTKSAVAQRAAAKETNTEK